MHSELARTCYGLYKSNVDALKLWKDDQQLISSNAEGAKL